MSEILHLNLHREFFAAIANKQKRIEYQAITLLAQAVGRTKI
jgi:hypothetical protein